MLTNRQKFELICQVTAVAINKLLVAQLRGEQEIRDRRLPDYRKMYFDLYGETESVRRILQNSLRETDGHENRL